MLTCRLRLRLAFVPEPSPCTPWGTLVLIWILYYSPLNCVRVFLRMAVASDIGGSTSFDRNSPLLSEYYYFGVLLRR